MIDLGPFDPGRLLLSYLSGGAVASQPLRNRIHAISQHMDSMLPTSRQHPPATLVCAAAKLNPSADPGVGEGNGGIGPHLRRRHWRCGARVITEM